MTDERPDQRPSMSVRSLADSRQEVLAVRGQRPGADSGNPQVSALDITGRAGGSLGVWECRPGGWPVVDREDTEVAIILSGRARITDGETGIVHSVGAGDLVVLPPRWTGRWDIEETVRKIFVVY